MYARQRPHALCALLGRTAADAQAPDHQVIQVTETPGYQTEACDAEESVEDLRVDFDPDAAWGVEVITAWVTHGRCRVAKEEEEHATPGDDIKTVNGDEEAPGREEPAPEGFQADGGGGGPGQFGRGYVAVRVL